MGYRFEDRGDRWFGHVFNVYDDDTGHWIGGVMQGKVDKRWSAVTPSGRSAELLPFLDREEAAKWLGEPG